MQGTKEHLVDGVEGLYITNIPKMSEIVTESGFIRRDEFNSRINHEC